MSLVPLALAALAAIPRPQDPSIEPWARELVDSAFFVTDDSDARLVDWLGRVEREPQHPLAEATLRLVRRTAPEDPAAIAKRVLALRAANMTPDAAAVLSQLQAEYRAAAASLAELERRQLADAYPDRLRRGVVLGPIADPFDAGARAALFADPGLDVEHAGLWGRQLRWQVLERGASSSSFDVEDTVSSRAGWALCAFAFGVPEVCSGVLELDFSAAYGPRFVNLFSSRESGFRSSIGDPTVRVSINGEAPQTLDFVGRELASLQAFETTWRKGNNVVLVQVNCGAGMNFGLRVLGPDRTPIEKLFTTSPSDPLGELGTVSVGGSDPSSSESYLERRSELGPYSRALLGWLQFEDSRFAAGIDNVERALEAAPTSLGLRALLAELYGRASHLPETWRRGRARELIESVLADEPRHTRMQVAMARILAPEDKEEQAIESLLGLSVRNRVSPSPLLELAALYPRLDLEVPMERQLEAAAERAPNSRRVSNALVRHWEDVGLRDKALAELLKRTKTWNDAGSLRELASAQARAGLAEAALATQRTLARIDDSREYASELAESLIELRRYDEADRVLAGLESSRPYDVETTLRRADVACERGDAKTAKAMLASVLAREPSNSQARTLMRALGGLDPARLTFRKYAVDLAKEPAGFDPKKWSDHVVRAIDATIVHVFEDGGWEQISVERDFAGDLEGCEALGRQSPRGEMLRIATIKAADKSEHEPVLVDGEYVMPSLQPGDAVESIAISSDDPPSDGVPRIPKWFFASVDKPFALSRYVVSLPKSLGLELVQRNFHGEHRVHDEGERVVHEFVVRDAPRVIAEPLSPPTEWYLPWIEFGRPIPRATLGAILAQELAVPTRVTPAVARAAAAATSGVDGEEARAKALHAFVVDALDKRSPLSRASATTALLTREGNGAVLYAALLEAAGIDAELHWSRNVDPQADPEPEPSFVSPGRWTGALFVQVRPKDGPPAWCDMARKTMPYGTLLAGAPRAEAFAARSLTWIEMPDVLLADRMGDSLALKLQLGADRTAAVELELSYTGNTGHVIKEQVREIPKAQMKRTVTGIVSRILPGIDVAEYEARNLESKSEAMSFVARGRHKNLLDANGDELYFKLPFPALELGRMAAGEGARTQPLFLQRSTVTVVRARVELGDGLALAEPLAETRGTFGGGTYVLAMEDVGEHGFTLVRELFLPAQVVAAEDHAALVEFARRVDEAERVRLRLRRAQ